jgi:uncharacterized protein (TIRG00374 family)
LKKQAGNILKFIFFLGLGVFLVWLAIKDKSEEELHSIKQALEQADYRWIGLSFIVTAFSHLFRAWRWKLLLAPLGHNPKSSNTFFSVMVGYLANLALPRLGEVTRCGMLNQYEKIPFTEGFGTVIAERALDLVCLILIFFITLFIEFEKIYGIANELIFKTVSDKGHLLLKNEVLLIVVFAFILAILSIFFYFRKKIRTILSSKISGFINGLWQGLLSIKHVNQPFKFIFHTLLIWLMYILQVYVCFFSFPETTHLSFVVAMVVTVFGSLGVIAVPGGTGAYQAIVIQILTSVYLISVTSAFAFAWAVWSSQIIIIILLGVISLILLPLLNKKKEPV